MEYATLDGHAAKSIVCCLHNDNCAILYRQDGWVYRKICSRSATFCRVRGCLRSKLLRYLRRQISRRHVCLARICCYLTAYVGTSGLELNSSHLHQKALLHLVWLCHHALQVIMQHPPVLSYSIENRLQPFMSFLREIGIVEPAQTVLQRPTLLGLDADKNLRAIVGYLQENGHSAEDIAHLLQTSI